LTLEARAHSVSWRTRPYAHDAVYPPRKPGAAVQRRPQAVQRSPMVEDVAKQRLDAVGAFIAAIDPALAVNLVELQSKSAAKVEERRAPRHDMLRAVLSLPEVGNDKCAVRVSKSRDPPERVLENSVKNPLCRSGREGLLEPSAPVLGLNIVQRVRLAVAAGNPLELHLHWRRC
jgi:hypothetical protein